MQRNEIIQKLIEKLELIRGVDNGYYVYPEDHIIAEELLSVVEECDPNPWHTNDWFGEEDD